MNIREALRNRVEDFPFEKNLTEIEPWASMEFSQTDLPRLRAGQVGGQVRSLLTKVTVLFRLTMITVILV